MVQKITLKMVCLVLLALLFIVLASLIPLQRARAWTVIEVSGNIASDTTWSPGTDNVYLVTGDVQVLAGVTLTITPGTIVKFQNDRSLLVDGKLVAIGTSGQKIYFTFWADDAVGGDTNGDGTDTVPNPADENLVWGRIRLTSSSDDASTIEYATIRYAGNTCKAWNCDTDHGAIEIVDASPTVRNAQINNNHLYGIGVETTLIGTPSQPIITNNTIATNQTYALSGDVHSQPVITGNTISGNGGNGMEIRGGVIQANIAWDQTSVVYIVSGDVTVTSGYVLTIAPTAIVKFRNDCSLLVDGKLTAVGASGQRIYFTFWADDAVGGDTNGDGTDTVPNPADENLVWGRIRFASASDDTSTIEYATIRYAGNTCKAWNCDTDHGAIEIVDASPTVRNAQINNNHLYGIGMETNLPDSPSQPAITSNTIATNQTYALSGDVHSQPVITGNTISGNGGNGMEIRGGVIQANIAWDQTSVVYIVSGDVTVTSGYVLTIAPTAIVKFRNDCSLLVDGKLTAVGASGQRIYFTFWADDAVGGDTNGDGTNTIPNPADENLVWGRIRFASASDDTSTIEYATIRYAGNTCKAWNCDTDHGAIEIVDASPTVRNAQINNNHLYGIGMETNLSDSPSQPTISTNAISTNRVFALSSDVHSQPILAGNTYTGNIGNGMEIRGGTIQANVAWDQTSTVYIVTGDVTVNSGYSLTIAPDAIIKLRNDVSLLIDGKLTAVGTSEQKIYFTYWQDDAVGGDTNGDGTNSLPNPTDENRVWGRIRFASASDDTSTIDYAIVRYAGNTCKAWNCDTDYAAIEIVDASPIIENTYIYLNHLHGLSTITNIVEQPSDPTLTCVDIENNVGYGLYNETPTVQVSATNLWWGSTSGPYHATLNTGGKGDAVSDGVQFIPWSRSRCVSTGGTDYYVYLPLVRRK